MNEAITKPKSGIRDAQDTDLPKVHLDAELLEGAGAFHVAGLNPLDLSRLFGSCPTSDQGQVDLA